ncbi:RICIN domain-containing protein [Actinacidiphila acididurans]|uniref:Ricin-type beta-trefoil lectin domain protein n=1 Tax=Actinacidiphila acididurans TaxID=2784346 RepID=A0ABS2TLC4_9ACTN|nr:RICIN domain-containing protein [Actinacidiphila acididurans]MBM9504139.1 ricin-type beta-trefoil lectin domain protein [Actinacidiphila acididurans]
MRSRGPLGVLALLTAVALFAFPAVSAQAAGRSARQATPSHSRPSLPGSADRNKPAAVQDRPLAAVTTSSVSGGYFRSVQSGKCMDAVWSHDNGTDIHQWDCYGGATQLWYWNGEQVVNVDSGKCLDAVWSHANGQVMHQWDCYNGTTQQWFLRYVDNGTHAGWEVVNVDSGKCLDAQWSTSNGTGLVQWDCYGGDTQLWTG